jgi:cadherin 23
MFVLIFLFSREQVGKTVAIVRASDPDAKPVLRYHMDAATSEARGETGTLVSQADFNFTAAFALGGVDGHLRVVRLIDRERVDIVRLVLLVEDLAAVRGRQTASSKSTKIFYTSFHYK